MVVCMSTLRKESEIAPSPGMAKSKTIDLRESLKCTICYEFVKELKLLATCGHSFCNRCIKLTSNCPQCRNEIKPNDIIPNKDLQNCVDIPREGASQLISIQDGKLVVNEEVLENCFQDEDIANMPVCVISVLGEKRTGKSTLMSCIVRALTCMEKNQPLDSWLSHNANLTEFECKQDSKPVTKGIWIYNKHFKIKNANNDEVAVFVLDIEGSLGNDVHEKFSIKISTLSILLSSYQIVNTANRLKTTDFSYLKDYLDLERIIGGYLAIDSPKMDILVRDWQDSEICTRSDCYSYLKDELEGFCSTKSKVETRLLKKTLDSDNMKCFFLPHPGKDFTSKKYAKPKDMDEDFLEKLQTYFTDLSEMVKYPKAYKNGNRLTCSEFGKLLKDLCKKTESCSFESKEQVRHVCEEIRIQKENDKFEEYMKNKTPSVPPKWEFLTTPGSIRMTKEAFDKHVCDYFMSKATDLTEEEREEERSALEEKSAEIFKAYEMAYNQYKKEYSTGIAITAGIGTGIGAAALTGGMCSILKMCCIFLPSVGVGVVIGVLVGGGVKWYFSRDNGDIAADNKKKQQ